MESLRLVQDRQKQRAKLKKLNLDLIERYWNTQKMLEDQPAATAGGARAHHRSGADARHVPESSPRRQSSGEGVTPLGMQERKLTRQETSKFNFASP